MVDATQSPPDIDSLRAGFRGDLILPDDPGYDERRSIFNAAYDKHPGVIACCEGTADVAAAIRFARAAELEIAVRCGGRHPAGYASTDGGLVIDLSRMRGVHVDPNEQTAWVQCGANGGDVLAESELHGLGAVTGAGPTTGIAGVDLHGGIGMLSVKMGWGSDTILELQVVTAEGAVLRVAPDEHPDLFWAMRGAGSNFGVATWMKLQLCPVAKQLLTGSLYYDGDRAREILEMLRDFAASSSDDVMFFTDSFVCPVDPSMPEELHGKLAIAVNVICFDPETAEDDVRPLLEVVPPVIETIGRRGMLEFMTELDEGFPRSRLWYDQEDVDDMSDAVLDVVLAQLEGMSGQGLSPMTYLGTFPIRGAMARDPKVPNAHSVRHGGGAWAIGVNAAWDEASDDKLHESWSDSVFEAVRGAGVANGKTYLNAVNRADEDRQRRTYGDEAWERLRRVKAEYDPDNVFHLNHNIPPAS